jgi:hypothetical protein
LVDLLFLDSLMTTSLLLRLLCKIILNSNYGLQNKGLWYIIQVLSCTSSSTYIRGSAGKSLARTTSLCRRMESIVSLERGACSYGGWLGFRASVDVFGRRKMSCHCLERNPGPSYCTDYVIPAIKARNVFLIGEWVSSSKVSTLSHVVDYRDVSGVSSKPYTQALIQPFDDIRFLNSCYTRNNITYS